jgi:hypothetical protein
MESIEINGYTVEMNPFSAYDFMVNINLFLRNGVDTISTGMLVPEEMDKALKIIFSNCRAIKNGEEKIFSSPTVFKEVFGNNMKRFMEIVSQVLSMSGLNTEDAK